MQVVITLVAVAAGRACSPTSPAVHHPHHGRGRQSTPWLLLGARMLTSGVGVALAYVAVTIIPVGEAGTLFAIAPLFSTFIGSCLGEGIRARESMAAVLIVAGVGLVLQPRSGIRNTYEVAGAACAIGSAALAATSFAVVRQLRAQYHFSSTSIVLLQSLGVAVASPFVAVIMRVPLLSIPSGPQIGVQWGVMVLPAMISFFSQMAMTRALAQESSAYSTIHMTSAEVLAAVVAQRATGQTFPNVHTLSGAVIILMAQVLTVALSHSSTVQPMGKLLSTTQRERPSDAVLWAEAPVVDGRGSQSSDSEAGAPV